MKRFLTIFVSFSALAALSVSCEKEQFRNRNVSAIKLTVSGVSTKAKVITDKTNHSSYSSSTYNYLENSGFNISAYATQKWKVNDIELTDNEFDAGIYTDPDGGALKNVKVSYYSGYSDQKWRIAGNDKSGYADPTFNWINGVAMNFFAYAPIKDNTQYSMKGTLTIGKSDTSTDANYPFAYSSLIVNDQVTSTNCDDLIFAYTQHTATFGKVYGESDYGKLVSGSTDKFDLKFYHALAQIRFCVSTNDDTFDPAYKLVYIKMAGVENKLTSPSTYYGLYSSGSCVFAGPSTFSWSSLGNLTMYSQTFNASFVNGSGNPQTPTGWVLGSYGSGSSTKNLYTCTDDVFLVIPQSHSECVVEVGVQNGSNPVQILKGHLPSTAATGPVYWEAGKYYTYKIGTVGEKEDLSLSMTLVDWAERENYIPIG